MPELTKKKKINSIAVPFPNRNFCQQIATSTLTCSIKLERSFTQEYPLSSDALELFDNNNYENYPNVSSSSSSLVPLSHKRDDNLDAFFPAIEDFKGDFSQNALQAPTTMTTT